MGQTMQPMRFLTFASEAELVALAGSGFVALAVLALLGDRRRTRRERLGRLDRVGWIPWTFVFLCCAIIGGGLLAMSLPVVLGSL